MSWFDRVRRAAERAAERVSGEAERAAQYVAHHGPGFVGEGTAEMLAERDYRKARDLAKDGLDEARATEVIRLLLPVWQTPGHHAILINRLLGRAYTAQGEHEAAREHSQRAIDLLRDPAARRGAEAMVVEETGLVPEEIETDLLLDLASLDLADERYDVCLRETMEILAADPGRTTAYYLQAAAMQGKGMSDETVAEVLVKALPHTDQELVLDWVKELLPSQLEWFERLAR